MAKAKLHASQREEYASGIEKETRVISINVNGKRLVLMHSYWFDCRGSHYGETEEEYNLVQDHEKRKKFLKKYRGKICISDDVVAAIAKSESHCVAKQSSYDNEGVWEAVIDGRHYKI